MLARISAVRISAVRRIPQLVIVPARFTSSQVEGSVAQSKGFSKKEKAHEDEYIHRHEVELLQKLKAEIEKKKTELDDLTKKHSELEKNSKK
ncbi:hypothetical protein Hypma_001000 [Hypsizygus marmoreus]|uniref:ATPase inhibitor, mitochondrial n=1 Tax=Hypsizygus marmoreus TaxID=39966 RepID=A0A369J668_HYPMA|nr:hypothetical protein Hypma_001000 [Hypsizygus marmoreus]